MGGKTQVLGLSVILLLVILTGCTQKEPTQTTNNEAIATGNLSSRIVSPQPGPCVVLENLTKKELCLIRTAVKENDDSYCLQITTEIFKDICYMQLAAWTNEYGYCEEVSIPREKDLCYFGMAIQTSNVYLCDEIRDTTDLNTDRAVCKQVAAVKNTKENIRNDSELEDNKILDIAYYTSADVDRALIRALENKPNAPKGIQIPTQIRTVDDANQWLTYYYIRPNPDLTVDAIEAIVEDYRYNPEETSGAVVTVLAQVFRQNEEKLDSWMVALEHLDSEQKVMVWQALWIADTSKTKTLLGEQWNKETVIFRDYIDTIRSQEPPNPLENEVSSPFELDMLWGTFFATGDKEPIVEIFSTLPWSKEYEDEYKKRVSDVQSDRAKQLSEEETRILVKYAIGAAAKWGLTSNAIQHSRVYKIISQEIETQDPLTQEILREVITKAEQEKLKGN